MAFRCQATQLFFVLSAPCTTQSRRDTQTQRSNGPLLGDGLSFVAQQVGASYQRGATGASGGAALRPFVGDGICRERQAERGATPERGTQRSLARIEDRGCARDAADGDASVVGWLAATLRLRLDSDMRGRLGLCLSAREIGDSWKREKRVTTGGVVDGGGGAARKGTGAAAF